MGKSDTPTDEPNDDRASVLVVDDEELISELCGRILERKGYEVHAASRIDDALELARTVSFDVIVCDILMPGLPGHELAEKIGEMQSAVATLFISGHAPDSHAICDVDFGDASFLQKPFEPVEFVEAVAAALKDASNPTAIE